MTVELVAFKSRREASRITFTTWEVIKDYGREVDIRSLDSGYILYSVRRERLETVGTGRRRA